MACPVCAWPLTADRHVPAHWWKPVDAPRVSCAKCLAISWLALRADGGVRARLDVSGVIAARVLDLLRSAREAYALDAALDRLREDRLGRRMLRTPEVFALARSAYAVDTVALTANVQYRAEPSVPPLFERFDTSVEPTAWRWDEAARWFFRAGLAGAGRLVAREGWVLELVEVEGIVLRLRCAENRRVYRAPLDLVRPS